MHPGSDTMGAPVSFAQRRPNAHNLPNFELPPPTAQSVPKYAPSYAGYSSNHPGHGAGSAGNLLTPPSSVSESAGLPNGHPTSSISYAPNNAYAPWSSTVQAHHSYGYHSTPGQAHASRGPYSPMAHVVTGAQVPPSPATTDSHLAQQYPVSQAPYPSSGPMSAPATLSSMSAGGHHSQQASPSSQHSLMPSQTPVSAAPGPQPSPIPAQDGFRPPPTPTYYTQQSHGTPQPHQPSHYYSTGPSPTQPQPSPLSAGPLSGRPQLSPGHGGPVSALSNGAPTVHSPHPYQQHRYASYPGAHAPIISNINNPHGQAMLMGGLPHGMMPGGFNSGHAASLQHMYGTHPHPSPAQQNDRPFKCDQCPQSFNRNHDLKRHKRIHLAVKPFPCGHCDKSFSRKDALKRHILVKGCGKAANADAEKADGNVSPDHNKPSLNSPHHDVKAINSIHS